MKTRKILRISPQNNLQDVFDSLLPDTEVILTEGVYRQKAILTTPNITLTGEDKVEIVWDDFAKKPDETGWGGELTTFKSFTLAITADNVTMRNITVANDKGKPTEFGQEVALFVNGNNFTAENCVFLSTQDTLFCGPLPDDLVVRYRGFLPDNLRYREGEVFQKFVDCKILGTVDFIFGCANALFENCEIISADDGRNIGYVAAPAHHLAEDIGFVFRRCNFEGQTSATVFLARAWRDFGKAVFVDCRYGEHIAEEGFVNWQGTERTLTARFAEFCKTAHRRAEWTTSLTEKQSDELLNKVLPKFEF